MMKVAGGLLTIIGLFLAVTAFLYQNDTGKSSPLELYGGLALVILGIIIFCLKPKGKKNEK